MRYFVLIITMLSPFAFAEVDLVKVDKSENKMYLVKGDRVVREYQVAFGANPKGHKQEQGDKKTPEGFYTLDFKKEDSSFYRAMHISYPNERDKENAKQRGVPPGGAIMVHGQPNRLGLKGRVKWPSNWTNGCIALTNTEMDEFMTLVSVGTPIHIAW